MAAILTSKQLAEVIEKLPSKVVNDPAGVLHYWQLLTAYYTAKLYEESRPLQVMAAGQ
jgi:hypothetical protein